MFIMGVFFQILENLMWYLGGVGLMDMVFICVLVVCSNICVSICGVLRFIVGLDWLYMHSMIVSDGSTYW